MDWSVAAVTVRTSAGEVTPVRLAVMLLVPVPTPVASPAALIVATVVVPEDPRYLTGDVCSSGVGVSSRRGELLRGAFRDGRTDRGDRDGLQRCGGDRQNIGGRGDAGEASGDVAGAGADASGQASGIDGGNRCGCGVPRHLAGDVRGGRVAVSAGCGELLRVAFSDGRTYRSDRDGDQCDVDRDGAGCAGDRGSDGIGCSDCLSSAGLQSGGESASAAGED